MLLQDEPRVTTFSLHCAGNFFSEKQRSDLDVEVPPGAGDAEYLALLQEHLPPLFERVKPDLTFFQVRVGTKYQGLSTTYYGLNTKYQVPELTFFQAGVDPHEDDALGKLHLSSAGLKRRNKLVYDQAAAHATRLVVTMGGGYPKNPDGLDLDGWVASRPFLSVVQCHMDVYRAAAVANARPW